MEVQCAVWNNPVEVDAMLVVDRLTSRSFSTPRIISDRVRPRQSDLAAAILLTAGRKLSTEGHLPATPAAGSSIPGAENLPPFEQLNRYCRTWPVSGGNCTEAAYGA